MSANPSPVLLAALPGPSEGLPSHDLPPPSSLQPDQPSNHLETMLCKLSQPDMQAQMPLRLARSIKSLVPLLTVRGTALITNTEENSSIKLLDVGIPN